MRRTAGRLDAALAGRELTVADIRVPRFATADLRGAVVAGTAVVGKHLLTRLRLDDRDLTLHSHLRMDGRWATGAAAARPAAGPGHQIRVWLQTPATQAVGLRIAMVEVLRTADEARLIGHLGPDILGPQFDAAAVAGRVRAQRGRGLAESLLDQKVLCGLGTIWTAETAFAAGTGPWTPAADSPGLESALALTRRSMLAAVAAPSRAQLPAYAVYGRLGRPCRTCGSPIRSGRVGQPPTDRITYYCPRCQPGPAQGAVARGR